ncbi:uncharacterized protein [Watersipora subatra]|uniref:uncharacterized protein n=1 Tax=Watersipora subatra TaxID=2589382 RepID=UPI00355C9154
MLKVTVLGLSFLVSVTALSCIPCSQEAHDLCPIAQCHKSERVRGLCECCDKCGQDLGEKCTETSPCYSHLRCYALDRHPQLPYFYNGICVSNQTYNELPPEPTPCLPCQLQVTEPVTEPTSVATPSASTLISHINEKRAVEVLLDWARRRINKLD